MAGVKSTGKEAKLAQFEKIDEKHRQFIEKQQMFFVATAAAEGRVNTAPKGMDSLRVLAPNRIVWLNLTGDVRTSQRPKMGRII